MNLEGKKITVMGLGLLGGGVGTVKWLMEKGADVLVTDLKTEKELENSINQLKGLDVKYVLGQHRTRDFKEIDLVVRNPAVPKDSKFLKVARENNISIETEMSLFFKFCPCSIIGITGTKGKSTTTKLIYEFLKNEGEKVILGGNIRTETLPKLDKLDENSMAVLELSSWQLQNLKTHGMSPHGTVITNIKEDHLNRYSSLEEYMEDKASIFKFQKENDYLVLNYDNKRTRNFSKRAPSKIYFYSLKKSNSKISAYLKDESLWFKNEKIISKKDIKLKGDHNLSNVLGAITVAKINGVGNEKIKRVLSSFRGLSGRLELVRKINEVSFYNDSCATNPEAAVAALKSFSEKIALIAGGSEKNLSFDKLAKTILEKTEILILLKGRGSEKLRKEVKKKMEESNKEISIKEIDNMKEAVELAFEKIKPKGVVLLSPGCASFSQFENEFDRAENFIKAVNGIK